jgi:hypothetical protein
MRQISRAWLCSRIWHATCDVTALVADGRQATLRSARRLFDMAFGEELNERTLTTTQRALRVVARTVLRELKRSGYSRAEMVTFATELLDLVTTEIRSDDGETS